MTGQRHDHFDFGFLGVAASMRIGWDLVQVAESLRLKRQVGRPLYHRKATTLIGKARYCKECDIRRGLNSLLSTLLTTRGAERRPTRSR
jgi:hypothetical protein